MFTRARIAKGDGRVASLLYSNADIFRSWIQHAGAAVIPALAAHYRVRLGGVTRLNIQARALGSPYHSSSFAPGLHGPVQRLMARLKFWVS